MPTFGISTRLTIATDLSRSDLKSFYKSFSADSIKMDTPVTIGASSNKDFDLSTSSFVIVIADVFGLDNEILKITFTDTLHNTFLFENVGFLMLNASNLINMNIENSSTSTAVKVMVIY